MTVMNSISFRELQRSSSDDIKKKLPLTVTVNGATAFVVCQTDSCYHILMKKRIDLICDKCGVTYQMVEDNYKRKKAWGKTEFHCLKCNINNRRPFSMS